MPETQKGATSAPETNPSIPSKRTRPQEYDALMDMLSDTLFLMTDREREDMSACAKQIDAKCNMQDRLIKEHASDETINALEDEITTLKNRMVDIENASYERYLNKYSVPEYEDVLLDTFKRETSRTILEFRDHAEWIQKTYYPGLTGTLRERIEAAAVLESIRPRVSPKYTYTWRPILVNDPKSMFAIIKEHFHILTVLERIAENRGDNDQARAAVRKAKGRPNGYEKAMLYFENAWRTRWILKPKGTQAKPLSGTSARAIPKRCEHGVTILNQMDRALVPASKHVGKPESVRVGHIGNIKNIVSSVTVMPYKNEQLSRALTPFDRLMVGGLFAIWKEQGPNAIITTANIFGVRHPGKEPNDTMQRDIENSLDTIAATIIRLDVEKELCAIGKREGVDMANQIKAVSMATYLCPLEKITIHTVSGETATAWRFYAEKDPQYFMYLDATKRFTTFLSDLTNICDSAGKPMYVTKNRDVITDYMLMRVRAKGMSTTILADTIVKECVISPTHRTEALEFAGTCLEYFVRMNEIKSFKTEHDTPESGRIKSFDFTRMRKKKDG